MSLHAITQIMSCRVWPDHAQTMHAMLAADLRQAGFYVTFEYPTAQLGDERAGRIDLYVTWQGGAAGIELDARRPRRRSIDKLRLLPAQRIIGVRGIEGIEPPDGIDAVVPMRVRAARQDEIADRRTINRWK